MSLINKELAKIIYNSFDYDAKQDIAFKIENDFGLPLKKDKEDNPILSFKDFIEYLEGTLISNVEWDTGMNLAKFGIGAKNG